MRASVRKLSCARACIPSARQQASARARGARKVLNFIVVGVFDDDCSYSLWVRIYIGLLGFVFGLGGKPYGGGYRSIPPLDRFLTLTLTLAFILALALALDLCNWPTKSTRYAVTVTQRYLDGCRRGGSYSTHP